MRIRLFGHFEAMAPKEIEVELERPVVLKKLLKRMAGMFPALAKYASFKTEVEMSAHLMVVKNGKPVKLDDEIQDNDKLYLMTHIAGG